MIKIKKNDFVKALKKCNIVAKRNATNEAIRLKIGDNRIMLVAYEKNIGIITKIPADSDEVKDIAVNAGALLAVASRALKEEISLEIGDVLTVISGRMRVELPLCSTDNVIERYISAPKAETTVDIRNISECSHALENATDRDYKFSSYYVEFSDGGYQVTALDGKRISRRNCQTENVLFSAIIGGKDLDDVIAITETTELKVSIDESERMIQFASSDDIITITCYEGKYFAIDQVITTKGDKTVLLNKPELLDALNVCQIFDDKAILEFKNNKIVISSISNKQKGSSEIDIPVDINFELKIGINIKYLQDALKSIDEDTIYITMNMDNTPLFIYAEGNIDTNYEVILPINIRNS